MSEPTRVYPPGPFPPTGQERPGTIDLGVRLRDTLFRRELIAGPVRGSLAKRLSELSSSPQALLMGLHLVEPFLDTWPLAFLVDDARKRWAKQPDGHALAVLARAASVVTAAIGWTRLDRRWPLPDEAWMRAHVGDGPHEVVSRGPMDGAPAVAAALALPWGRSDPLPLPAFAEVPGDEVAAHEAELVAELEAGSLAAVRLSTPAPTDDDTRYALDAIRAAAPAQRAFERYGLAGLLAPDAPTWDQVLGAAPSGTPGDPLGATCHTILMNRLDDEMEIHPVGALVWDGPYRPLLVTAEATAALRKLDGQTPNAEIARALGWPTDRLARLLDELTGVGACSA